MNRFDGIKPLKKKEHKQKRPHPFQDPAVITLDDAYCKTVVQLYNNKNEYDTWTPDQKYFNCIYYLDHILVFHLIL